MTAYKKNPQGHVDGDEGLVGSSKGKVQGKHSGELDTKQALGFARTPDDPLPAGSADTKRLLGAGGGV